MIINNPMKNSPLTIHLYNQAPLTKERNGIIDNLNAFLNSKTSWLIKTETSTNPFELSMTQFKLNASDSNAFITTANIQYMRISWAGRYFAYYWVNKINRSSNDVITLDIELDFLNTLHNGDSNETSPLLSFSALSSIERQHEPRFYTGNLISTTPRNIDLPQKVDRVNENIQVELFHKPNEDIDVEPNNINALTNMIDNTCWYVVYCSSNTGAVHCYLLPEYRTVDNYVWINESHTPITQYLSTIESIDRTKSNIIKIIKLPYCPVNFYWDRTGELKLNHCHITNPTVNVSKYEDDVWEDKWIAEYLPSFINDDYVDEPFLRTLEPNYYNGLKFNNRVSARANDLTTQLQTERYLKDTKLEHSQFKGYYFVYDSFAIQYKPENYLSSVTPSPTFYYAQSSDCDSSLIFQMKDDNYMSETNYFDLISSTRKNEIMLYSNDYINYMRNGYNYDRTKQVMSNIVNIAGSGVALAGSIASGNAVGAVGAGMGLTKSITGAISGEIDFQKNLNTLKNKASNVSDVNDSSLFHFYGNSRLRRITMTPYTDILDNLDNLFYYYGYSRAGKLGTPNVTSRAWFNFLKGEIVLANAEKIPTWLYNKVKEAYRTGVTYHHCHRILLFPTTYEWNLEQTRENYETFLLGL